MYKRIIKHGETVGLKLTSEQRKLLLTGLVFLHDRVKEAIRSTPSNRAVKLTLSDLEDMAGHVAAEANHTQDRQVESILSDIFENIEELLSLYAEEKPTGGTSQPTAAVRNSSGSNAIGRRIIVPIPVDPKRKVKIRMTVLQRLAVLSQANLTPGLKGRIEHSPLRPPDVEFTRDEIDDLHDRISQSVAIAKSPHRGRLISLLKNLDAIFEQECDEAFGNRPTMRAEMAPKEPDSFLGTIAGRLTSLGDITCRAMFGGHGIYWSGTIFAIVDGDRLYLKVDDQSRGDYQARGMGPFRPNERQMLKSYYEVPGDVLDDADELLVWAKEAIRAARP